MRILPIDNAKEKMQLAKSIYSANGNFLLVEGTGLTRQYIKRLRAFGVSTLYISNQRLGGSKVNELVAIQTKNEATNIIKEVMTGIRKDGSLNIEKVYKVINNIINDIIEELLQNPDIAFNLIEIRTMDNYHFAHNVAVCVLALITGIALNYDKSILKLLGVGAILHDIGKAEIPLKILNKKGKLSGEEYAIIKKHSQIGYNIIKNFNINDMSARIAWQHHERFDGSGYPLGLKGNEIHEFAMITALADVYDAMSTDRVYRKRILPQEVIEYIRDQAGIKFDPALTKIFLQNITPFPIGSMVLLNNGEKGVVVKTSTDFPARPLIKVMYDNDGKLLKKPLKKDLKKELTLFISKVFRDEEKKDLMI